MNSQITTRTAKFANAVGATLCIVFLSGCGEDLRPKVAELEAQLEREKVSTKALANDLAKQRADFDAYLKKEIEKRVSTETQLENASAKSKDLAQDLEESKINVSVLKRELERERAMREKESNYLADEQATNRKLAGEKASLLERISVFERVALEKRVEAQSKSTLEVRVGVTMRSGEAKPFANGKIYLSPKSVSELFQGQDLSSILLFWVQPYTSFAAHRAKTSSIVEQASVATATTDFNGQAVFENVPKGEYYLICATLLGGGAVFQKAVTISSPKVSISLSNDSIIRSGN
jgi:hypothetical protein